MAASAPSLAPLAGQSADTVLMVRPAGFSANPQTRDSNAFQATTASGAVATAARAEFEGVVEALRDAGVGVIVVEDEPQPPKPDAVFPNNWFTTHADGSIVLYPMCAPNRRSERRVDVLQRLDEVGYRCSHLLDLSPHETAGRYLEGTGSLVIDRVERVAYACLSPRTDRGLLALWARELGHETVAFEATDRAGKAIYHTNVMLSVGARWAVVCLDAIGDPVQRATVAARLTSGGRDVIEITLDQMHGFAGNILELASRDGTPIIVASERARRALGPAAERRLAVHARLVSVAIPNIEDVGGGSVRCMLAEVFLPRVASR
jgi:hypothetical protein